MIISLTLQILLSPGHPRLCCTGVAKTEEIDMRMFKRLLFVSLSFIAAGGSGACTYCSNDADCQETVLLLKQFLTEEIRSDIDAGNSIGSQRMSKVEHFGRRLSECASNAIRVSDIDYYHRLSSEVDAMIDYLNIDKGNTNRVIRKHFLHSVDTTLQTEKRDD